MQNRLKLQQILAAIGSSPEPVEADEIVHEAYDWHQIRYFDTSQLAAIEDLGSKITPSFAAAMKRAFRADFAIELIQVNQTTLLQYKQDSFEENAFMAFETEDKNLSGALALPTATTQDWVTRLLGGSGDTTTLSQLEITLLSDIAVSLIEALSSAYECPLLAQPPLAPAQMSTPVEDTTELCSLTFSYREEATDDAIQTVAFVMPCFQLAATLESIALPAVPSQNKLSEAMHEHVNNVPIEITAEFGRTQLSLEQAMNLNVGDVLLLDKELDDPMTLKIDNRLVFYCKPAQCEDQYAVIVTQNA